MLHISGVREVNKCTPHNLCELLISNPEITSAHQIFHLYELLNSIIIFKLINNKKILEKLQVSRNALKIVT